MIKEIPGHIARHTREHLVSTALGTLTLASILTTGAISPTDLGSSNSQEENRDLKTTGIEKDTHTYPSIYIPVGLSLSALFFAGFGMNYVREEIKLGIKSRENGETLLDEGLEDIIG